MERLQSVKGLKKTRVQQSGDFNRKKSPVLLAEKAEKKRPAPVNDENADPSKRAKTTFRRCGVCGETMYCG